MSDAWEDSQKALESLNARCIQLHEAVESALEVLIYGDSVEDSMTEVRRILEEVV